MEYGRRMTSAFDRATLADLLQGDVTRPLGVERSLLLLPLDHHLVPLESEELRLPVSDAAVRRVAAAGAAQRADRGRLKELIDRGRTDLGWTRVWVPLMRGTDLRGMWLLGERERALQFAPEDLRCLTAIGRQAAIALETTNFAERERQTASEMRALYRQVVSVREAERGRVSRELHDGVLQDLCAVTRDLKALEGGTLTDDPAIADLARRSGEAVSALRAVCHDLRPPLLGHDLVSALRTLVADLDGRSTAPVHMDTISEELRLPDDVALALFRITQEALHNAIQHADASEIAVRLTEYPHHLRLTVTDDGRGIQGGVDPARFVAEGHYGLAGMRERAAMIGGKLDVQTAPDYGTVVILEVPC
jgi:signal transduction histidine kinase